MKLPKCSDGHNPAPKFCSIWRTALAALAAIILLPLGHRAAFAADGSTNQCVLIEQAGKVEIARKGSTAWTVAEVNTVLQVGDRLRTALRSRATLKWSESSVVRVDQLTSMEIQPPAKPTDKPQLDLKSGTTYLFSREKPTEVQFRTPVASGAIRGTEFNLAVADDGRTVLSLIDGAVDLVNEHGSATLGGGEQGTIEPGKAPTKSPLIDAVNVIQWVLYYPQVVAPEDLGLSDEEKKALAESLEAYRQGDLLAALARYPENQPRRSAAEHGYYAALLLSVGQATQSEAELKELPANSPVARALRELIVAVKHGTPAEMSSPTTASEWMARSYYEQSHAKLADALKAADAAVAQSPNFGAAKIRQADLQFGFGRTAAALKSLNEGLELSPRNAQGFALRGFLLSAQNKRAAAMDAFNQAITLDGSLANAWLGRGLLKIRESFSLFTVDLIGYPAGLEDLQVAATLEPQRSVLRSYLGKAFAEKHDLNHARKELDLARKLDPNDPTAWLYSALLDVQENRDNAAVSDLEKSKELNENRSLFRSQFLLDQDQAVRGANLAAIYRDVGMTDISVQEAARAVNQDYGNYSSHLFLANSYDALRDPKLFNLRYETPWYSELLVANLLAPVGAANLSQTISQQEYSRFFASDSLRVFSSTEYFSNGSWVQNGSLYGNMDNTAYALDAYYRNENGYRPNNELEQMSLTARFKQQLTKEDSVFLQVGYFHSQSGDVAQYYNQYGETNYPGVPKPSATFQATEKQNPNLLAGYHREWAPGSHTLFLFSRIEDNLQLTDGAPGLLWLRTAVSPISGNTNVSLRNPAFFSLDGYESDLTAYSTELQQIWENHTWTFIVGGRAQWGNADTTDNLNRVPPLGSPTQVYTASATDLSRYSAYGYAHWQILDSLRLIGGLSYDYLEFPVNIDTSPISTGENHKDLVSPKAGILWSPWKDTHLRGAYARSLGGVFFDNSVRLEPTEIAGFTTAYRSLLPESAGGIVPGTEFDVWGLGFDQAFKTHTYLYVQADLLKSDGNRTVGMLVNSDTLVPVADTASSTRQSLDYEERALSVGVHQLLGEDFALGVRYKVADADLTAQSQDIAPTVAGAGALNQDVSAILQQLWLYVIFQHRCGFFAQFDTVWSHQTNTGYTPTLPGDDFWQLNVSAGYRFMQRRGEVSIGLLNITDQDYRLNPLTLYNELPRERTLAVRLKLNF